MGTMPDLLGCCVRVGSRVSSGPGAPSGAVNLVTNSPPSMRTGSYQVSETAQVKTRDLRRASVDRPVNVRHLREP